jgi:molybdopterin/thiamine biosynthesis adenylyltransferase
VEGVSERPPQIKFKGELYHVAYKTVTIIGVGTLGGFTTEAISNLEGIEKLVLIDHDIVEHKNLRNSIYRQIDVGSAKVDALKDIILQQKPDLEIWAFQAKYNEGVTKLSKEDLVIDCRDFTYDRQTEIDARFYISSRYLMGDFRKNVKYKEKSEGKYISELTKNDLRHAASIISMMIHSNVIESLILSQSVQKYELDFVKHVDKYHYDVVYENVCGEDKFVNLADKIVPILDINKSKDLTVFIGSKVSPINEKVIPVNTLNNCTDLVQNLLSVACCQNDFNNFVVSMSNSNGNIYIELIPDTGAA